MQSKFGVLRFISGFYKVVGIIFGVITIFSVLGICATSVLGTSLLSGLSRDIQQSGLPMVYGASTIIGGFISAIFTILLGAMISLGLYAFGELISLLVSLEENTRATVALLQNRPG
jgi:hypothetical protein